MNRLNKEHLMKLAMGHSEGGSTASSSSNHCGGGRTRRATGGSTDERIEQDRAMRAEGGSSYDGVNFKKGGRTKRAKGGEAMYSEGGETREHHGIGDFVADILGAPSHIVRGLFGSKKKPSQAQMGTQQQMYPQEQMPHQNGYAEGGSANGREPHFLGQIIGAVAPHLISWALNKADQREAGYAEGGRTKRAKGGEAEYSEGGEAREGHGGGRFIKEVVTTPGRLVKGLFSHKAEGGETESSESHAGGSRVKRSKHAAGAAAKERLGIY